MQKPRLSKQCVNGVEYWRCMGYPTLHGEAIIATGASPREAYREWLDRFYTYALANRRNPPLVWRMAMMIERWQA
ncbi:hypothetical protein MRB56_09310 [Halomonas cupida]|uniref:hypothetical protein n=1 Tax=Halomonas cupida TaxID=44933 RepID=UPI0039B54238